MAAGDKGGNVLVLAGALQGVETHGNKDEGLAYLYTHSLQAQEAVTDKFTFHENIIERMYLQRLWKNVCSRFTTVSNTLLSGESVSVRPVDSGPDDLKSLQPEKWFRPIAENDSYTRSRLGFRVAMDQTTASAADAAFDGEFSFIGVRLFRAQETIPTAWIFTAQSRTDISGKMYRINQERFLAGAKLPDSGDREGSMFQGYAAQAMMLYKDAKYGNEQVPDAYTSASWHILLHCRACAAYVVLHTDDTRDLFVIVHKSVSPGIAENQLYAKRGRSEESFLVPV